MKSRLVVFSLGFVLFSISQPLVVKAQSAHRSLLPTTTQYSYGPTLFGGPVFGSRTGGLREEIDLKHKKRYAQWKDEFLAAEIARLQWELHAKHPHLTLTITVSARLEQMAQLMGGNPVEIWEDRE